MAQRRFSFRKLVRDGVPGLLAAKGITVHTENLPESAITAHLKAKLTEEADEATTATTREKMAEELADVLEVVDALGTAYGLTAADIAKVRAEKHDARGGFDNLVFVTHVDVEEGSAEAAYYRARPEDFPELKIAEKTPA